MVIYRRQEKYLTGVFVLAANLYVSELLDRYGKLLSDKQYRILDGYYNNDLSLSEIAENEGITRQGVADFVKRSEAQLFEFEEKLGFLRTTAALKNAALKNDVKEIFDIIDKL